MCNLFIDTPSILAVGVDVWKVLLFRENHVKAAFVGFISALIPHTNWHCSWACLVTPSQSVPNSFPGSIPKHDMHITESYHFNKLPTVILTVYTFNSTGDRGDSCRRPGLIDIYQNKQKTMADWIFMAWSCSSSQFHKPTMSASYTTILPWIRMAWPKCCWL